MLTINGMGNHKISYKSAEDISFDSLKTYITLAKKAISRFANQFYNGLASKMLKDEDAISNVAQSIMMADWRWDENYLNEKGTKKSRYSYRNQCAIWAIQTHITKDSKNKKKKNHLSIDHIINPQDSSTAGSLIEDVKAKTPESILIEKENKQEIKDLIDSLLDLDYLSSRQKDYIKLYYFDRYTFEKIGNKYGITREAVRQGLNKAIDLIKNSVIV
jgi:RNA polymerase sigma factor (sigma-70 family)